MPKKSKSISPDTDAEEAIRNRAYLMWEADGRPEGRAEHYWHLAQSEAAVAPEKPKRKSPAKASAGATEKKPRKAAKTG